jgi:hypothetical protein
VGSAPCDRSSFNRGPATMISGQETTPSSNALYRRAIGHPALKSLICDGEFLGPETIRSLLEAADGKQGCDLGMGGRRALGRWKTDSEGSAPRRLLGRYNRVGPYSGASVDIDAERPAACERLLYLLASRVLVKGVNGQLGLDLNDEWPLLLWHGSGIQVGRDYGELIRHRLPEMSHETGGLAASAAYSTAGTVMEAAVGTRGPPDQDRRERSPLASSGRGEEGAEDAPAPRNGELLDDEGDLDGGPVPAQCRHANR